jgi:hypothetical protein
VNVGEQYEAPNTSLMMDTNDSGGVWIQLLVRMDNNRPFWRVRKIANIDY